LPIRQPRAWLPWLPVLFGLSALFVPTFIRLSTGTWTEDAYSHGPIVLLIVLWLFWEKRKALVDEQGPGAVTSGSALLVIGLLVYVVGRSQNIDLFEVSAQIPVLTGALLLMLGWRGTRQFWFPLLFMIFLVPLPGFVTFWATGLLKALVSDAAENLLYALGYPIARSGVVIMIGPYQLLVAEACSGLNSLYSLSALGLLYLHLTGSGNRIRAAALLASILPIAFLANMARVAILALVTYHFGEEAGQGFVHGLAGIVLFVIALMLFFAIDGVLRLLPLGRAAQRTAS
jgi:exosortase B